MIVNNFKISEEAFKLQTNTNKLKKSERIVERRERERQRETERERQRETESEREK